MFVMLEPTCAQQIFSCGQWRACGQWMPPTPLQREKSAVLVCCSLADSRETWESISECQNVVFAPYCCDTMLVPFRVLLPFTQPLI